MGAAYCHITVVYSREQFVAESMAAGWTMDETKALVGIWGAQDVQSQLDGVARNRSMFEKIATAMADLGFDRTWQQCKTKVKNLTQKYRKVS